MVAALQSHEHATCIHITQRSRHYLHMPLVQACMDAESACKMLGQRQSLTYGGLKSMHCFTHALAARYP